jgi:hypothetical protein
MGKYSTTVGLLSASWQILKKDKTILFFPLCSLICCLLVSASFITPWLSNDQWQQLLRDQDTSYYLLLFLFYFCNYFIIVFFNAAVVACAAMRMGGGDPTVADGFRVAVGRLPLIAAWALFAATAGLILRLIEDRSGIFGRFVAGLLGLAWTLASLLVIPILVIDKQDPITALKNSAALLKKCWGEELLANFSFAIISIALAIPVVFVIAFGKIGEINSGNVMPLTVSFCLAVIYAIIIGLVISTLKVIFQTALYLYVRDGQVPAGFQAELFKNALTRG